MEEQPEIIKGGSHTDYRGTISFINDFDMRQIRRSYIIEHPNQQIVRAWRAHRIEQRWFIAVAGEFLIRLVKIDNWENPDKFLSIQKFELIAEQNEVLCIPAGYGSSIQALVDNSKLIVFADYGIEHAKIDDYVYPADYWK